MTSEIDFEVLESMQKLNKVVDKCASEVRKAHNVPQPTMDYIAGVLPVSIMEKVLSDEDESEEQQDDEEYAVLTAAVQLACADADVATIAQEALVVSLVSKHAMHIAFDIVEEKEAFERGDCLKIGTSCAMYDPKLDQNFDVKIIALDRASATIQFVEFNRIEVVPRELIANSIVSSSNDEDDQAGSSGGECELCRRQMRLTRHHLIPRVTHRTYRRKGYTREALNFCALICSACHRTVHRTEPNQVLAARYNTVEKLMAHPSIQLWVAFASKIKVRQRWTQH
jgi:hypothetical protein